MQLSTPPRSLNKMAAFSQVGLNSSPAMGYSVNGQHSELYYSVQMDEHVSIHIRPYAFKLSINDRHDCLGVVLKF